MRYLPLTEAEKEEMLASLGLESLEDLFAEIPRDMILKEDLPLPAALSEAELLEHFQKLTEKNKDLSSLVSFMGAGAYDHLIPSIIPHLVGRGEFLTAYTPYQAEISQGVLQSIFEYQTMIAELTGMEASNASMYDGATALAEAVLMACAATRRETVVLPATLHPEWQEVVKLYLENQEVDIIYLPFDAAEGTIDLSGAADIPWQDVACAVVQQPNFFGNLEEIGGLKELVHNGRGLFVMAVDPISLSLLKSPGELGAHIVVGDGQSLGNAMGFGGPSFGFFATSGLKLIRRMPGRIAGQTVDTEGRRGFVLTLQTREQHIRREKATSNICTNQALNALTATIYLAALGKQGFVDVGRHCVQKAHYFQTQLLKIDGLRTPFAAPFFREFVIEGDVDWGNINLKLLEHGFLGGLPLGRFGQPNRVLFSVTEARTKEQMDSFITVLRGVNNMTAKQVVPLIFERSSPGRRGYRLPELDVPEKDLKNLIPEEFLRDEPVDLPEVSELEVVRHYTQLSRLNYAVDVGFYPLGSCTMKYNPRIHEDLASLPGLARLHPYQPEESVQGALQLIYELSEYLAVISGLSATTLQPAAGAHGELTGLMLIKAYHTKRGDTHRSEVIVPDSAHGTNPATTAMVGYRVVEVPSDARGGVDVEALKGLVGPNTAGLMLTNPNTLGLFDENIAEIADIVHDAGGLLYYDGANANAILGIVRAGDMGFDVVHYNLHKTFSTPHGGGGPGAGPISVAEKLAPFLPGPLVRKEGDRYSFYMPQYSIGRVKSFYGQFLVCVRAYAYILSHGGPGLKKVSETAVLHANYMMRKLQDVYHLAYDRICMHEFVLSGERQKKLGVRTLDIAKRLLDYGYHAPTVYFPLNVDEAIMVEPTETEPKATLDEFIQVMHTIAKEAEENPDLLLNAPTSTPVSRLDESKAARQPILRWQKGDN